MGDELQWYEDPGEPIVLVYSVSLVCLFSCWGGGGGHNRSPNRGNKLFVIWIHKPLYIIVCSKADGMWNLQVLSLYVIIIWVEDIPVQSKILWNKLKSIHFDAAIYWVTSQGSITVFFLESDSIKVVVLMGGLTYFLGYIILLIGCIIFLSGGSDRKIHQRYVLWIIGWRVVCL